MWIASSTCISEGTKIMYTLSCTSISLPIRKGSIIPEIFARLLVIDPCDLQDPVLAINHDE